MSTSIVRRIFVLLVISLLVAGSMMGCENQTVTMAGEASADSDDDDNIEEPDDDPGETDGDPDETFEPSPEEDGETFAIGTAQGSWRVAVTEGDKPLVYFDIIQDEGSASGSGDYLMGMALSELFDGEAGELNGVTVNEDQVEVQWNPTDDDAEMYRVEVTRESEDLYTGEFTGERYPEIHPVTMTRRQVGNNNDRVATESE